MNKRYFRTHLLKGSRSIRRRARSAGCRSKSRAGTRCTGCCPTNSAASGHPCRSRLSPGGGCTRFASTMFVLRVSRCRPVLSTAQRGTAIPCIFVSHAFRKQIPRRRDAPRRRKTCSGSAPTHLCATRSKSISETGRERQKSALQSDKGLVSAGTVRTPLRLTMPGDSSVEPDSSVEMGGKAAHDDTTYRSRR